MKEKLLKIFSLLKNKRYRAIVIVLIYLAFFGLMFLILSIKNSGKSNVNFNKEKSYLNYNNYAFSVKLTIGENKYDFIGKRYKDSYEVDYGGEVYKFKFGDDIELEKNVYESLNFDPIFNNELIRNSKLVSETKLVDDNVIEKKYNLGVCSYGKITDLNMDNCDESLKVIINVGYKNNEVIYIDMNLDDLFSLISGLKKYDIRIDYSDIDKVLEF